RRLPDLVPRVPSPTGQCCEPRCAVRLKPASGESPSLCSNPRTQVESSLLSLRRDVRMALQLDEAFKRRNAFLPAVGQAIPRPVGKFGQPIRASRGESFLPKKVALVRDPDPESVSVDTLMLRHACMSLAF